MHENQEQLDKWLTFFLIRFNINFIFK
jgi:hypothetical protein